MDLLLIVIFYSLNAKTKMFRLQKDDVVKEQVYSTLFFFLIFMIKNSLKKIIKFIIPSLNPLLTG